MKLHRTYSGLAPQDRGASVAIGNFDGVHLGHQSVLALARAAAAGHGSDFGVITFEPHPRQFFNPQGAAFRLMTADARVRRMEKLGVEQFYELPFNSDMAGLTPETFVQEVLVEGLGVRHVVTGSDFRFGRKRGGDVDLLARLGTIHGFDVTAAPLVSDGDGDFSSTAIRTALSEGRPAEAARILGHWHRIEGEVRHGDKRGRTLGFPTINLGLDGLHLPRFGVYAVIVDVLEGAHRGTYAGAGSIGERPTFGVNAPNLEVNVLNFSGDLYGTRVSVALIEFLRPELKFDTVADLVARMSHDVQEAGSVIARYRSGNGA